MQESWVPKDKRVLGVFVPLIEALTERQWGDNSPPREVAVKHVALFATPATVASRAFQRELAFRAIGVDVEAQPCGGVVDAIEQGDMILAEALVRSHVEALLRRMPKPEAAILGCTHYPLMEDVFRDALGPGVAVYSQASLVAESLADYLTRRPEFIGTGERARLLTTGDPKNVGAKATQFLRRAMPFEPAFPEDRRSV
jgi:glutamate racemase